MTHTLPSRHRRARSGALAWSLALALGLSACGSSPQPADYRAEQPAMDFRGYFSGPVQAHGMFTDRSGRVIKRFTVALQGRWSGDEGVLEEDFTYSNGEKERRVWQLKDLGGGRFEGRAADIVGVAEGEQAGNAIRFRYTMRVPVDGKPIEFQFDDWMYRVDGQVVLNRAAMSKFGIHLGDVTLSFRKP